LKIGDLTLFGDSSCKNGNFSGRAAIVIPEYFASAIVVDDNTPIKRFSINEQDNEPKEAQELDG
jgi:hypothetical protein